MPFVKDFSSSREWKLKGERGDKYIVICIDLIFLDCRLIVFYLKLKVCVLHGQRGIFRLLLKAIFVLFRWPSG